MVCVEFLLFGCREFWISRRNAGCSIKLSTGKDKSNWNSTNRSSSYIHCGKYSISSNNIKTYSKKVSKVKSVKRKAQKRLKWNLGLPIRQTKLDLKILWINVYQGPWFKALCFLGYLVYVCNGNQNVVVWVAAFEIAQINYWRPWAVITYSNMYLWILLVNVNVKQ